MARVVLRDVSKAYGSTLAVRGVSLAIEDGEFVVLVGPSGCGKTTTLRMIAGLEEITGGTLEIGDRVVNQVPPKDRDIAMVFQSYALYPHMTVFENMAFGLRIRKTPRREIQERVERAAEKLEIQDYLARKPKALSGGQRQRVAMGRAMVRQPSVFLFDEPLSNLDAKLRVQMRVELGRLHRSLRTTTIYVTHDQVEAMTLADRMVVMSEGQIQQVGTPRELYEEPANLFVAGFLGSPTMNQWPLRPLHDGASSLGEGLQLPRLAGLSPDPGWTAGVRPQDIRLADATSTAMPALTAPLEVELVEHMGAESYAHGLLAGAPAVAQVPPDRGRALEGQRVSVTIPLSAFHIFDGTGGAVAHGVSR